MICSGIARASAAVLALGGLALLFAADAVLPVLIPGYPPAGAWLGQVLAAAWLGVTALTWSARSMLLGGIYGRPVVSTNATLFLISALSLLRSVFEGQAPMAARLLGVVFTVLAALYFWLMLRGPFARDFEKASGSHATPTP
ncbi:MAG: hypothetical protein IT360_10460 [Gemmatimonadaceae bacterium]|nr:hypothetical protein [Gemmatimonadaceae bacterium]